MYDKRFEIKDKKDLVSICYSTWFDPVINRHGDNPPTIFEALEGKRDWGPMGEFHYWGKPALGYYRSTDKNVIRTHMTQLYNAGIDFIIIDNTNVGIEWKNDSTWDDMVYLPGKAILDTMVEMRAEGLCTPYLVMWCRTEVGWAVTDAIYNEFFTDPKYEKCFVYWNDKPFFITTNIPEGDNTKITWRKMWGLNDNTAPCEWSFLQHKNTPNKDCEGNPEQICVCTAAQATYMTVSETALSRENGATFHRQWKAAFDSRPKVVTVTWWNEWIAQRFEGNIFVDNYTEQYSRDIEPMEGGHGDMYYRRLVKYIDAYKNKKAFPEILD